MGGHPGRPASRAAAHSRKNKAPAEERAAGGGRHRDTCCRRKAGERPARSGLRGTRATCLRVRGCPAARATAGPAASRRRGCGRAVRGVLPHPTTAAPLCPSPTGAPSRVPRLAGDLPGEGPAVPVPCPAAFCTSTVAAEANANLQRDRPKIINRAGFPLSTVGVSATWLSRAEVPCRLPPSPHPSFAPARLGGAGCGHGAGAGGERGAAAGGELQFGRHVPPWWPLRVPGGVCVSIPPRGGAVGPGSTQRGSRAVPQPCQNPADSEEGCNSTTSRVPAVMSEDAAVTPQGAAVMSEARCGASGRRRAPVHDKPHPLRGRFGAKSP